MRDKPLFDDKPLIKAEGLDGTTYQAKQVVFSQGDVADAIFYIQSGHVRIPVVSNGGEVTSPSATGHSRLSQYPITQ